MRIINVTILENEMKPDSTIAGMAGDNLNTKLSIEIPESWAGCTYRLKFKTSNQPDGYAYVSDTIALTSGKIEFLLPSSVMVAGKLWVQSVAEKASGSDTVVVNSATMVLDVGRSIGEQCNEYGFPPNYSGLIDQTLNEINDEITTQANIAKTQAENSAASATAAANSASTSTAQANRAEAEANRAANIDAYTKDVSDTRYSNALTGTASGAMAHMTDVGIGSLRRLAVLGETTETGTGDKGPDNPYALAGIVPTKAEVCGKNLLHGKNWSGTRNNYGITYTDNADGSITVAGTATGLSYAQISFGAVRYATGVNYTASGGAADVKLIVGYFTDDTMADYRNFGVVTGTPLTVTGNGMLARIYLEVDAGKTVNVTVYPLLEQGQTATAYEPYSGQTVALPTLTQMYGDGTVSDEYDAVTGKETRRWKRVELKGTETWDAYTTNAAQYTYKIITADRVSGYQTSVCSHFRHKLGCWNAGTGAPGDYSEHSENFKSIFFVSSEPTVEAWKSWLAEQYAAGTPVTLIYQRLSPTTAAHAPVRIAPPAPMCNVYADQGDVDVTYNRDINIVLSQMQAAIIASGGVI